MLVLHLVELDRRWRLVLPLILLEFLHKSYLLVDHRHLDDWLVSISGFHGPWIAFAWLHHHADERECLEGTPILILVFTCLLEVNRLILAMSLVVLLDTKLTLRLWVLFIIILVR